MRGAPVNWGRDKVSSGGGGRLGGLHGDRFQEQPPTMKSTLRSITHLPGKQAYDRNSQAKHVDQLGN